MKTLAVLLLLTLLPCAGALAVVYVDRDAPGPAHDGLSWGTAFLTIQAGVSAAAPGGEVWVGDGTYVENIIMGEGVQLYGGFLGAEPSGYETDLSQRDYANHIATIDGNQTGSCVTMAVDAVIDGFAITNGKGPLVGTYFRHGGGVYCKDTGNESQQSTAIRNSTVTNNVGSSAIYCEISSPSIMYNVISGPMYYGGVHCYGSSPAIVGNAITGTAPGIACYYSSSPLIASNTISGSSYYAGVYCSGSSPSIVGNTITENIGGGISCGGDSSPEIADNTITGNWAIDIEYGEWGSGGGIYCGRGSSPIITGNTISDNEAGNGGAIYWGNNSRSTIMNNTITGNEAIYSGGGIACKGSPVIANNTITGNTAGYYADWDGYGGGIYCGRDSSPCIANNTITGNIAGTSGTEGGGSAVYCDYASAPIIGSNIISENTSQDGAISCNTTSLPTLLCNDVWQNTPQDYYGCVPGPGDISADPLFVDEATGDFHLLPDSPCIDTGDNASAARLYRDFDGDPRICDGDGDGIAIVDIGADEYCTTEELTAAPTDLFLPGWVWFSIPLAPAIPDASHVLGFITENVIYGWDDAQKNFLLCPGDFTDLAVGPSYLAFLDASHSPLYLGTQPDLLYEHTLPAAGWSWVGVPSTQDIYALDLAVKKGGVIRSATEDVAAADPWLNWNWVFWDPIARTALIMSTTGGDDQWLHPWFGYRVWANTEDVTIIFP